MPSRSECRRPLAALARRALLAGLFAGLATGLAAAPADTEEPEWPVDPRRFQALEWRNIGPFRGGRATTVTGVVQEPDTFYFGATGGGVWKTEDAGTSWRNVSDGFFATGSVGAVAVSPSDPNVVWVGMGEAPVRGVMTSHGDGVYRSTDAGASWEHLGLEDSRHISRIIVHPDDPDVAWVAVQGHLYGADADRGVYRTVDGGRTWLKTLYVDDTTGASDLSIDPGNPRVLYAAMWQHRRYPWKIDSGGPGSGIHKSTDGGLRWQKLEDGLPALMGKIGVAVSPARPSRVWTIIEAEDGGLYRSDDAGTSWQRVNEERVLRARAWYYTHVTADPNDPDTVYVMNAPLLRSIDGGKSFEPVAVPHGDNHDLWIHPDDSRLMINANDGGANISRNGGATWSSQDNQPTGQFYRVNADNRFPYWLYGGQQDNSAIAIKSRSLDGGTIGGRDWHSIGGCESAWPAFDREAPRYVYAGCYQGLIDEYDMETGLTRGVMAVPFLGLGAEPKDLPYRFNWNAPILVSQHDPSVIYHAGNKVLRSRDRGRSWQEMSPDLTRDEADKQGPGGGPITNEAAGGETYNTITSLAHSPHDAATLWAGSDDGRVHVTTDDGASWRDVSPGTVSGIDTHGALINAIEISPHAPDRVLLAVSRYELDDLSPIVLATEDAGATWLLRVGDLPAGATVRVVREDPARRGLLYAGTEIGAFVSFDDGGAWQPLELGLPTVPVTDLMVHRGDLLAATQGRAFWILDDLTPLHGLDQDSTLELALLPPRPAYRTSGGRGEQPGAGTNADNGAVIYYVLPEPEPATDENADAQATAEVANGAGDEGDQGDEAADDAPEKTLLEIRNAAGTLVRTLSSQAADKEKDAEPLPTEPGLNRAVWDLRGEPMIDIPGAFHFGDLSGYRLAPGSYQLTLRHAGAEVNQRLEVLADPRIDAEPAAYSEQQALLEHIRATIQAAHDGVTRMRDAREQIGALVERVRQHRGNAEAAEDDAVVAAFEAAGERAKEAIDEWEAAVIQPRQQTFQDVINFPNRLNAELFQLLGEAESLEPIVNQGVRDRFAVLAARWREHAATMQSIVDVEIAALEALVGEHALAAILLPSSRLDEPVAEDAAPSAAPAAAATKVARLPIVERAIAHHGGERYRASETSLESCSKSGCSTLRARVLGDRFDLEAEGPTNAGIRRVRMTNETTEAWLDGRPEELDAAEAGRRRDWLMQRIYFAFLPYRLDDPSVLKQDLGLETWGDRRLHRVRVSFTPGSSTDADDAYTYWFDPQTAEVVQFAYDYDGEPGGLRFRRAINPRRVGGILFFDQENLGAEGDELTVDMITPGFAAGMRPVSTVRFGNIRVVPVDR